MLKKVQINEYVDIVFSWKDCPYQEVLDDFENAEFVNILTYNISSKKDDLLKMVNELDESVEVKLITNIPNRFATYYSDSARERSKKSIYKYLSKLDPDKFDAKVSTFFNFDNHSKVIMTNSIAYIGSANFSDESSNNFECGVIIRDNEKIEEINREIFSFIESESKEYTGSKITKLKVLIYNTLSKMNVLRTNIHEGAYSRREDVYDIYELVGKSKEYLEGEIYNHERTNISPSDLDEINTILYEVEDFEFEFSGKEVLEDIYRIIDQVTIGEVKRLTSSDEDLYKFSCFDETTFAQDYMDDNSYLITEENLDNYAQKGFDIACETKESWAESIKEKIELLDKNLGDLILNLQNVIIELEKIDKGKKTIDNT